MLCQNLFSISLWPVGTSRPDQPSPYFRSGWIHMKRTLFFVSLGKNPLEGLDDGITWSGGTLAMLHKGHGRLTQGKR